MDPFSKGRTDSPFSLTLWVTWKYQNEFFTEKEKDDDDTWNVLPVSRGTVQLMGSGDLIINCSGDLTRVGSGGD